MGSDESHFNVSVGNWQDRDNNTLCVLLFLFCSFFILSFQLFEDVTNSGTSEPVDNVWIVPGHVFVSLRNSTKLITFDCKPVIYHHVSIFFKLFLLDTCMVHQWLPFTGFSESPLSDQSLEPGFSSTLTALHHLLYCHTKHKSFLMQFSHC